MGYPSLKRSGNQFNHEYPLNVLEKTLAALVWILEVDIVSNATVNGAKIIALKMFIFATLKLFPNCLITNFTAQY